jgi:hypothetical protein
MLGSRLGKPEGSQLSSRRAAACLGEEDPHHAVEHAAAPAQEYLHTIVFASQPEHKTCFTLLRETQTQHTFYTSSPKKDLGKAGGRASEPHQLKVRRRSPSTPLQEHRQAGEGVPRAAIQM